MVSLWADCLVPQNSSGHQDRSYRGFSKNEWAFILRNGGSVSSLFPTVDIHHIIINKLLASYWSNCCCFPSSADLQCVVPTGHRVQPPAVLPALPPPRLPSTASPLRRQPNGLPGAFYHTCHATCMGKKQLKPSYPLVSLHEYTLSPLIWFTLLPDVWLGNTRHYSTLVDQMLWFPRESQAVTESRETDLSWPAVCLVSLRRRGSSRPWPSVWDSCRRPLSLPASSTVPHAFSGRSAPSTWWLSGALRSQGSPRCRRSNRWWVQTTDHRPQTCTWGQWDGATLVSTCIMFIKYNWIIIITS